MACWPHGRPTRMLVPQFLSGALVLCGCDEPDSLPRSATPERRLPAIRGEAAPLPDDSSTLPKKKFEIPELRGVSFVDVAAERGLHYIWPEQHRPMRSPDAFGSGCAAFDGDNDGWLDLVIVNYVVFGPDSQQYCEYLPGVRSGCRPQVYPPEIGEIWRNTGQGGFELVPENAGMDQTNGVGLVLAFTDLDGNGRMDFYIGNDGAPAEFLHNLGRGSATADFNNDGRIDLLAVISRAR